MNFVSGLQQLFRNSFLVEFIQCSYMIIPSFVLASWRHIEYVKHNWLSSLPTSIISMLWILMHPNTVLVSRSLKFYFYIIIRALHPDNWPTPTPTSIVIFFQLSPLTINYARIKMHSPNSKVQVRIKAISFTGGKTHRQCRLFVTKCRILLSSEEYDSSTLSTLKRCCAVCSYSQTIWSLCKISSLFLHFSA
jgi:hypothetical protein